MEIKVKKTRVFVAILFCLFTFTSCGSNFNQVGITMGNTINKGEVTSQSGNIFYIGDGGIYKKDKKNPKGKMILKGDYSNINAVGEKIYFYDKSISTICKANSEGFKVERIAEIYTDKFVVNKDNIFASILVGDGSDNLESPNNYNIVSMKITSRKLASTTPNTIYSGGRLVGTFGDNLYIEKTDSKDKKVKRLYQIALNGKNEKELIELSKDSKAIVTEDGIFLMGAGKDGKFAIYQYSQSGKLKGKLTDVDKNEKSKSNAFNYENGYVYYENYKSEDDKVADEIIAINVKDKKKKTVLTRDKGMEFHLSIAENKVFIKERKAGDLDTIAQWKEVQIKK